MTPRSTIGQTRMTTASHSPLRSPLFLALVFIAGAALSAAVTTYPVHVWHRGQEQLVWTSFLQRQLSDATRIARGDQAKARREIERDLPGLARSVAAFGASARTATLLRDVRRFYAETGTAIPPDLDSILPAL